MKRRKALSTMLVGIGGTILVPNILLTSCNTDNGRREFLTQDDIALLDEIGETIIPATASSPGAKAANIGEFMKVYISDCYTKVDQKILMEGISKLNNLSKDKFGTEFIKLSSSQKHNFLLALDRKAQDYDKNKSMGDPSHYFSMMKDLTLFGYFTSETGATMALHYVQTPGNWDADVPYEEGDKAWF